MKYEVCGKVTIYVRVEVEADDEDHAIDIAEETYDVDVFAGNQSMAGLVGLSPSHKSVHMNTSDCYPEWSEAIAQGDGS
jgi:hypothetical protein